MSSKFISCASTFLVHVRVQFLSIHNSEFNRRFGFSSIQFNNGREILAPERLGQTFKHVMARDVNVEFDVLSD